MRGMYRADGCESCDGCPILLAMMKVVMNIRDLFRRPTVLCVMAGMVSAVTVRGADIVAPILTLDDTPATAPRRMLRASLPATGLAFGRRWRRKASPLAVLCSWT